jgi:cell division cycle 20-like protein 1, cofactor of APC complex
MDRFIPPRAAAERAAALAAIDSAELASPARGGAGDAAGFGPSDGGGDSALGAWVAAAASRAELPAGRRGGALGGPDGITTMMAWVSGSSPSVRLAHGAMLQRELLGLPVGGGPSGPSSSASASSSSSSSSASSSAAAVLREAFELPDIYGDGNASAAGGLAAATLDAEESAASAGSSRTISSAAATAAALARVSGRGAAGGAGGVAGAGGGAGSSGLGSPPRHPSQPHVMLLGRGDALGDGGLMDGAAGGGGGGGGSGAAGASGRVASENLDAAFAAAGGRPFARHGSGYGFGVAESGDVSALAGAGSAAASATAAARPRVLQMHASSPPGTPSRRGGGGGVGLSAGAAALANVRALALSPMRAGAMDDDDSYYPGGRGGGPESDGFPGKSGWGEGGRGSGGGGGGRRGGPGGGSAGRRHIGKVPYRVLDAPALADDFYLNLLDWSSQNVLVVGLASDVYMWNAYTAKVTKLCSVGLEDAVTSVAWTQKGGHVAIGTDKGTVQIWDATASKLVRTMGGHTARVGSLSWAAHTLATGGRDKTICIRDVRDPADLEARLTAHKQEVCGLRWSPDWSMLASGGNDNRLLLWSAAYMRGSAGPSSPPPSAAGGAATPPPHTTVPIMKFTQHTAAIKALAWSPHRSGLLASGGGTSDKCIRFFNTNTGVMEQVLDTGSQVCQLEWSPTLPELVSCHGYSTNSVTIWRYPTMSKVATLAGHTTRVLYMSMSPDGQSIVTGAGDETLRFWNVFPPAEDAETEAPSLLLPPSRSATFAAGRGVGGGGGGGGGSQQPRQQLPRTGSGSAGLFLSPSIAGGMDIR